MASIWPITDSPWGPMRRADGSLKVVLSSPPAAAVAGAGDGVAGAPAAVLEAGAGAAGAAGVCAAAGAGVEGGCDEEVAADVDWVTLGCKKQSITNQR